MPRYRYTGHDERVLHGLSHGVNATLHRGGHGQPEESTVVVQPGDEITTRAPYLNALLDEVKPPAKKAPAKKAPAKKASPLGTAANGARVKPASVATVTAALTSAMNGEPVASVQDESNPATPPQE